MCYWVHVHQQALKKDVLQFFHRIQPRINTLLNLLRHYRKTIIIQD